MQEVLSFKDLDFRNKKTEIGYWIAKKNLQEKEQIKTTKFTGSGARKTEKDKGFNACHGRR